MSRRNEVAYEARAEQPTDAAARLEALASPLTGEEASRYGKELLLWEYGADDATQR